MLRSVGLLLAAAFVLSTTACFHVTSNIPGVLDVRSDGSAAAPDASALPATATRTGLDNFLWGSGVSNASLKSDWPAMIEGAKSPSEVTIEDRSWHWFTGLWPFGNESSSEEWTAALGTGSLRNVRIGDGHLLLWDGIFPVAESVALNVLSAVTFGLTAPLNLVVPYPVTFTATGVRVQGSGGVANPPLPTSPK